MTLRPTIAVSLSENSVELGSDELLLRHRNAACEYRTDLHAYQGGSNPVEARVIFGIVAHNLVSRMQRVWHDDQDADCDLPCEG